MSHINQLLHNQDILNHQERVVEYKEAIQIADAPVGFDAWKATK